MDNTKKTVTLLEQPVELGGRLAAWLSVLLVIVMGLIVVLRYGFSFGSISLQESVIYINTLMVVFGAAYTLKQDGHVRVDVFYGRMTNRRKAMVNVLGTVLLLLPAMAYIAWVSWDYVAASWVVRERSAENSGLPWVYWLKSGILLLCALLLWQGVAELLKALHRLKQGNTS